MQPLERNRAKWLPVRPKIARQKKDMSGIAIQF